MAEHTRLKELATTVERLVESNNQCDTRELTHNNRLQQVKTSHESIQRTLDTLTCGIDRLTTNQSQPQFNINNQNTLQVRHAKLDFPRFDSSDPLNWLFRAEQVFFTYYDTPNVQRRDAITSRKGLCFTCDDKFTWNHKCPNKQALILMSATDDFNSLIETSEEQVNVTPVSPETIEPHLSLNAYHGSNGVATIRLYGSVNGTKVQVLLDVGSSDNFIQPWAAKHVRLPIEPTETFRVMVGSDTFLQVEGLISSFPLYVQNELMKFPAYVLLISGEYIILGAAWLATLGPHLADYSFATVKFYLDVKFITLTGNMSLPPSQAHFHHFKCLSATDAIPEAYTIHCFSMDTTQDDTLQLPDTIPHDLASVLHGFDSVIAVPTGLPPSRTQDHSIILHEGVNAGRLRPYRYPVSQKAQNETMVADMLAQDSYPMPTVDELLDELHGAQFYSKLDLRSGYHQILLKPEDRYKTAFRTHRGLYDWLVMPFGLTNAPTTFQALMNDVFRSYLRKFVMKNNFKWSQEAQSAFETLKQALQTTPVLVLLDFSKPFIVEMDPSGHGIGAILSQAGQPVAFFLRSYHTIQTPEQQALLPKLIGYNFRVEYKAGASNGGADGLSRCFNFSLSTSHASIVEDIQDALATSSSISSIIIHVEKDPVAMSTYEVKNGLVAMLEFYALARIATYFFYLRMRRYIRDYVRACQICQPAKHPNFIWSGCWLPLLFPIKYGRMLQWTLSPAAQLSWPKAWVDYLPWAEYWYNSAFHTSIDVTPLKVVYGRDPPSIITRSFSDDTPGDVIEQLQERDA
nr:hypothetical protein [Tanacetum cinerariifolium]